MDYHFPVLATEVISRLNISPGKIYVDATLGNGGHTLEMLKNGAYVFGIDLDSNNLKLSSERIKNQGFDKQFTPILGNYSRLKSLVSSKIGQKVNGVLLDLGLSQNQQKSENRGFSFNDSKSLDMRLNPKSQKVTAEEIINTASYEDLYKIFSKLGQETFSKPLIQKIISERQKSPIKTGKRLADIIRKYYKEHHIRTKIDPSTKIFMSLRITVNSEYSNIKKALEQTLEVVKPKGVVCIITFHSGEDRIVKQFIKEKLEQNLIESTLKPVKPSFLEVKKNPLSRSAILRSYTIV
jgi:16S rRNA (cytosine1402-N4)-methyltransferase